MWFTRATLSVMVLWAWLLMLPAIPCSADELCESVVSSFPGVAPSMSEPFERANQTGRALGASQTVTWLSTDMYACDRVANIRCACRVQNSKRTAKWVLAPHARNSKTGLLFFCMAMITLGDCYARDCAAFAGQCLEIRECL